MNNTVIKLAKQMLLASYVFVSFALTQNPQMPEVKLSAEVSHLLREFKHAHDGIQEATSLQALYKAVSNNNQAVSFDVAYNGLQEAITVLEKQRAMLAPQHYQAAVEAIQADLQAISATRGCCGPCIPQQCPSPITPCPAPCPPCNSAMPSCIQYGAFTVNSAGTAVTSSTGGFVAVVISPTMVNVFFIQPYCYAVLAVANATSSAGAIALTISGTPSATGFTINAESSLAGATVYFAVAQPT